MNCAELLTALRSQGAQVTVEGAELVVSCEAGPLPDALLAELRTHKPELMLALLEALVEGVARAYRVPEDEIPIMIATARGDQESAWICFRSLARELGLDVEQ
jgi:TubC N-terminal docking domain